MLHQLALLLGRLDSHETHRRSLYAFADLRRVGRIIFVALELGRHILRRRQPHLVAEFRQLRGQ
jgi:hypothetical protein